jgi:hypothetical protein
MFGKQSADAGQRSLRAFVLKVKCQEWLSPQNVDSKEDLKWEDYLLRGSLD